MITVNKKYYTTGELAQICNVSPTTIFRAILNKTLKAATTPGGHFRISREDTEEFLRKNNISYVETRAARILIVEDNAVELHLYERALGKGGVYDLKTTTSGYEAGFLTKSFRPDLILLDIFLGDVDGRQVAKLIHSDPELRHTKLVVITGTNDPAEIKDILALKFDAVLFKPLDSDELRKKIEGLLK